jgi:membrane associated rhomboid family serine protease
MTLLPLFDNVPVRRTPVVTWALIAANFVVWFWELGARSGRVDHYAFYPCAVSGPCAGPAARDHLGWPEGALTGMFLHASWLHILGNMLFLWIFGNNVEDAMGRLRFLVFYLAAGYAAALAQTWVTLHYAGIGAASVPNVGASGAIAGVLGAYLVLLPHARVVTLLFGFLPVPISALLFLGLWFVFQLWQGGFSMTHPDTGGGVAFAAHVGGFLFGALTVKLFQVRMPLQPRW